ncbi:MAG: thioredoxin family protein [Methylophilales bacterium]|nr:thioredoxin family protein [Methylophilales bacterium]
MATKPYSTEVKNMLKRFLIFAVSLLFSAQLLAAGKPFDQATFNQTQKDGKPVLVMIHADWCPTCRAQAGIVEKLAQSDEFKNIVMLRVDFDNQVDVVKSFHANRQSTLIVFKGAQEVGRSLGDTRESGIAALLKKAL